MFWRQWLTQSRLHKPIPDSDCFAVPEMNRNKRKESTKVPALEGKPSPQSLALNPTGEVFWQWNPVTLGLMVLFSRCCFPRLGEGGTAGPRTARQKHASQSSTHSPESPTCRECPEWHPHLPASGLWSFGEPPTLVCGDKGSTFTQSGEGHKDRLFPQMVLPQGISQRTCATDTVTLDSFLGGPNEDLSTDGWFVRSRSQKPSTSR